LDELTHGIYSAPEMKDVQSVSMNDAAFAALKQDGTVVTWGSAYHGGESQYLAAKLKDIKAIYAGPSAFTAVTQNGELISWGSVNDGQESQKQLARLSEFTSAIKVVNTAFGFAALMADGRVYGWGEGFLPESRVLFPLALANSPANSQEKVIDIIANDGAYAALKANGDVVVWGHIRHGGNTAALQKKLQHVRALYATEMGFVALRGDGTAIGWQGVEDLSAEPMVQEITDVIQIVTLNQGYAALRADGTVVEDSAGPKAGVSEVVELIPSVLGFTAKHTDGSLSVWQSGGLSWKVNNQDIDLTDVIEIRGNISNMIALTPEGKVLSWDLLGNAGEADTDRPY